MMIFDKLEDALEEAQFCASAERRKYVVKLAHNRYRVYPKYRKGAVKPGMIEMGFREKDK